MEKKVFFHVDVNSAYLSWEAVRRLKIDPKSQDIRQIPSVIGGDPNRRSGIVLAKSSPAKDFGIKTGENLCTAFRKCPHLKVYPADFDLYIECSKNMIGLLKEFSPDVYQYSIDEAFVDMTGMERLFGEPCFAADLIRHRMKEDLGFTVNVGVPDSMVLAKMAGDFSKPDKTHIMYRHEIQEKMWPLPINDLFFVGRKTSNKLKRLGVYTIGDLATLEEKFVYRHLKKQGLIIHRHANGLDGYDFFHIKQKDKSIGNSTTTSYDICDYENARHLILSLTETVCARLRHKKLKAGLVSIELVDMNFNRKSSQKKLVYKTDCVSKIYECACQIFLDIWDNVPIRHIGVSLAKVSKDDHMQLSLFEENKSKEILLYSAIDDIRDKYGEDSIKRAGFLCGNISHMEGGTSKNKKNGIVYL